MLQTPPATRQAGPLRDACGLPSRTAKADPKISFTTIRGPEVCTQRYHAPLGRTWPTSTNLPHLHGDYLMAAIRSILTDLYHDTITRFCKWEDRTVREAYG